MKKHGLVHLVQNQTTHPPKYIFIPNGDDSKLSTLNISTNPLMADSISEASIPATSGSSTESHTVFRFNIFQRRLTDHDIIVKTKNKNQASNKETHKNIKHELSKFKEKRQTA